MTEYPTVKDLQKVTEFVKRHGTPYDSQDDNYQKEPFATDVRAGKSSPIYNAHSYHTKVPPDGIKPFIAHYTKQGDLVLDPFCGSGMTGVAALKQGRFPILIELSPAAVFIAENYCSSIDIGKFNRAARAIMKYLEELANWLYETKCQNCGRKSMIEFVILSDEFRCPRCAREFLLYDVAVSKDGSVQKNSNARHARRN